MEQKYLKLKCRDCENTDCSEGSLYPSKNCGCTREIDEEEYDKYYYYTVETIPFLYIDTSKEYQNRIYKEFLDLCDKVYQCPLVKTFR